MPGSCTRCRFKAETFAAVMPVENDTDPLRRASQLKRVQSCPATDFVVWLTRADPTEVAVRLKAATRSAPASAAAVEILIDTASVCPVLPGLKPAGSGETRDAQARKNPSQRGEN